MKRHELITPEEAYRMYDEAKHPSPSDATIKLINEAITKAAKNKEEFAEVKKKKRN